jgi:hypothetical protein
VFNYPIFIDPAYQFFKDTVYQFRDDPWLKTHFMTKIFRFYTNLYKKIAFLNIKLDKKALKFVRFYSL